MKVRYPYGGRFPDKVPYPQGPMDNIWFMRQRVRFRIGGQLATFWIGRDLTAGPGTGDKDMYLFEVMTDTRDAYPSGWHQDIEGALSQWEEEAERVDFIPWVWED